MDEYVLGIILGAFLAGLLGFLGAYYIERQHYKRAINDRMSDRIYGPMFKGVSQGIEDLKSFGKATYNNMQSLKELSNDYRFYKIRPDLRNRLSELIDRFEKYQTIQRSAEISLDDVTLQEVEKAFEFRRATSDTGAEYVFLRLLMGKTMASALDLKSAIFLKLTPQDFIKKEKEKWGENIQVEVTILGQRKTLEQFESLYARTLAIMEKDPLYQIEKEQRTRLIKELEDFVRKIEPFVKA